MACSCATAEVRRLLGDSFTRVESPSLRLEKLLRIGDRSRPDEVDAVVKCHNRYADASHAFRPAGARTLKMKLGGRLIVNQAGGVIENAGLCLHRCFGFATLPGSAVKGVARHAAWRRWRDCDDEAERRELARKIAVTFGFPTNDDELDEFVMVNFAEFRTKDAKPRHVAGAVSFLPAVPNASATLVKDIVTCHHPKYYSIDREYIQEHNGRAADDEEPNPQVFPAIEAGASFTFPLLPTRRSRHCGFDPLDFAEDCLREALEDYGAGAKTAAGYGWFEMDHRALELERLERERREADAAERVAEAEKRAREQAWRDEQAQAHAAAEEEKKREEAAKLAAADADGMAAVAAETDFGRVISYVRRLVEARGELDGADRDALKGVVANCIRTASKKETRKWSNPRKGHWEHVRKWIGGETANEWFRDLIG